MICPISLHNRIFTNRKKVLIYVTSVSKKFVVNSLVYYYSHLSNKRGAWNKRGGGAKNAKSINVEVGILQLEFSPFVFK